MIYIASELVVFLAALAALVFIGTSVVILLILAHKCGEWSIQKFKQVTQRRDESLPMISGLPFHRYKPR
jgi:hypothetical protein